ncbi:MAG TPA: hypothetical protein PKD54_13900, partial [Pirellulaceae bacterium]|nr:hypothetical protein [Pirellulaceae bacterium]
MFYSTLICRRILLVCGLLLALFAGVPKAWSDELLVSDNFGNQILRFDASTGAFLGVLVSSNPAANGGLSGPIGMRLSNSGTLLVASQFTNEVLEYNRISGQFLGKWTSASQGANLAEPADLRYGPNGNMFIANFVGGSIDQFMADGTPLGSFTSGGPGIFGSSSFAFGPNGNLYVGSFGSGDIQEFDGVSGSYLGQFVNGLGGPSGLLFDTDNSLWVASLFTDEIYHFDSAGNPLGSFSTGGGTFPSHILVNPNDSNELFVALTGAGGIYRFHKNGTFLGVFAFGGGLLVPGQMLLLSAIPEPSSLAVLGTLVGTA